MKHEPMRQFAKVLARPFLVLWDGATWLNSLQSRERDRLQSEFAETRGLMPLLMKQRNGYRWSAADRRTIKTHIRTILGLSPYVVLLVAPGGLIALPVLAWWLDRRRKQRAQIIREKTTQAGEYR